MKDGFIKNTVLPFVSVVIASALGSWAYDELRTQRKKKTSTQTESDTE